MAVDTGTAAARSSARSRRIVLRVVLVSTLLVVVLLLVGGFLVMRPGVVMGTANPVLTGGSPVGGVVGSTMPTITGSDYDGHEVSITSDEHPLAIAVVAHWCQYCQAEMADLRSEQDAGTFVPAAPVAVLSTRHLPFVSWPPAEALSLEGFPGDVVVDSDSSLARRFGITSVPVWFFTDSDGVIREVVNGSLSPTEVNDFVAQAQESR